MRLSRSSQILNMIFGLRVGKGVAGRCSLRSAISSQFTAHLRPVLAPSPPPEQVREMPARRLHVLCT